MSLALLYSLQNWVAYLILLVLYYREDMCKDTNFIDEKAQSLRNFPKIYEYSEWGVWSFFLNPAMKQNLLHCLLFSK